MKQSNQPRTCGNENCLGWYEEITLRNEKWLRCRSCGYMVKVMKRTVEGI